VSKAASVGKYDFNHSVFVDKFQNKLLLNSVLNFIFIKRDLNVRAKHSNTEKKKKIKEGFGFLSVL
jgi:hypothetical protein